MLCVFALSKACGFKLDTCKNSVAIPPSFPKRNCLAKIIRAHSLPLLEIAPKPCYKKLHPKYPNNIFVPRQKGPERSVCRVYPPWAGGGDLMGSAKGGYVPAACRRERTIARRSQPPRRTSTRKPGSRPHRFAQIAHQNEPVVTSKCASGRPLLIDSAPPTEFRANSLKTNDEKISNRRQNTH